MAIQLISPIGSGGFGTVYEALIDGINDVVAIKQLRNPLSPDGDLARFRREVKIHAKLKHPNILPILMCDLDCDEPWFASPLAQCTLVDEIPTIRFQAERLNNLFRQILDAIQYAHEQNVIHRDLKPENILVFQGDNIKIADFGLGKVLDSETYSTTLTHTNQVLGTLHYMAPEQMTNLREVDSRADIYSLGKILYAMLTGDIPFPAVDLDKVDDRYRYIVAKCTDIHRDRRYQTVSDLISDFEAVVDASRSAANQTRNRQQVVSLLAGMPSETAAGEFLDIFSSNQNDHELYMNYFPSVFRNSLFLLVARDSRFKHCLEVYDDHISGRLPFEYCDVVADFYEKVFSEVHDSESRKLVLTRLLEMGISHNRWHVQDVFCRLLSEIDDFTTAFIAVEILKNHPRQLSILCDNLRSIRLMPMIRNAVDLHCKDYDLPF